MDTSLYPYIRQWAGLKPTDSGDGREGIQIKSQTKSQRPPTGGVTRPRPGTAVAARCLIRPRQATASDGTNAPYKRDAGGSNPPAPTKFVQLDGLFGNHSRVLRLKTDPGQPQRQAATRNSQPTRLAGRRDARTKPTAGTARFATPPKTSEKSQSDRPAEPRCRSVYTSSSTPVMSTTDTAAMQPAVTALAIGTPSG